MKRAALVFCSLVGLWSCVEQEAPDGSLGEIHEALTVCADGPTVDGIDVSKWQGSIDWRAVASDGVEFAFIRVSDGLQYNDEYFDANWSGARANGIIRGAYQFFRPGQDAVAQADFLLSRMGPLEPGDLPPVIDVEATDGQSPAVMVEKIRQWLDRVESVLGVQPIIYSGKYFWQDNVRSEAFNHYPLWIPLYGPVCPNLPDQWTEWVFFQTSSSGRVSGVSGNVDTNLFNGDYNALLGWTVGDPECGDGVCHGAEREGVCPEDCPVCEAVPAEGRIIEEDDLCFLGGGDPRWLRRVDAGHGGKLIWTHATDSDAVANFGLWTLAFDAGGEYVVEAFIDPAWAETKQADYQIAHAGQTSHAVIDQSAQEGWAMLGTFEFAAGEDQFVRVDDNTGEPLADQVMIAFDALRLTPVDVPEDPEPDPQPGPEPDMGPEPTPEVIPEPDPSPDPSPELAPEPMGDVPAASIVNEGCAAAGSRSPGAPWGVWGLLLGLGWGVRGRAVGRSRRR